MSIIKIFNQDKESGRTLDSLHYSKDCKDFQVLNDGTIIGEYRYCNLSTCCRQVDFSSDGIAIPMEAHYLPVCDSNGELLTQELFCTGFHDLRPYKERLFDNKVT